MGTQAMNLKALITPIFEFKKKNFSSISNLPVHDRKIL